ncbi:hypothetical protein RCL1_004195 [Eukaryota sp. TZLM3-RCL]
MSFFLNVFSSTWWFYKWESVSFILRLLVSLTVCLYLYFTLLPLLPLSKIDKYVNPAFVLALLTGCFFLFLSISPSPSPTSVSPNPLIRLLDGHVLKDFDLLVKAPPVSVELDISKEIPLLNSHSIQVIAGQPGCGKSVSLFSFLKDKHVLWVSGRALPCKNLARLGLNVTTYTEEHCLFLMEDALMTNNYTLVIDDAQVLNSNSLLTRLFVDYGSVQWIPFPIYFTVSDYGPFNKNLKPLIRRVFNHQWYYYPSDDVIGNLTTKLNLNFTKTMMDVGPSLRLIQLYAQFSKSVASSCRGFVADFKLISNEEPLFHQVLLNATRYITSDRNFVDPKYLGNSKVRSRFYEKDFLTSGELYVFFHNPLVRRAACTFFKDTNDWELVKQTCESVSFCDDIMAEFL